MGRKKYIIAFYSIFALLFLFVLHFMNDSIYVIAERIPIVRDNCIIIDAGHGGMDGGATSCAGILESTYNLQISLRLNDLLKLLGHETKMIRKEDISVHTDGKTIAQRKISDLKERVRIVNTTENGILVSIHQNSFPDSRYSGAQIFYAPDEQSEALAKLLQDQIITHLNQGSNRQCKKSKGIFLMDQICNPGVLIECGFLSNVEEEAKLREVGYQKKLCCIIASALDQYLSNT